MASNATRTLVRLSVATAALLIGCSSDSVTGFNASGPYITYALANGSMYRVEAKAGATPQNVSQALNALSAGTDGWLNASPDGAWLVMSTERFNNQCTGYQCLALVKRDLSFGETILINGQAIHPAGFAAVANGSDLIVYEDAGGGGSHVSDLWAVTRSTFTWSTPVLLTGGSPYDYHSMPAISSDGTKIVFDCGDVPYAQTGTAICEVGVTGAGFRVVLTPANNPPGTTAGGALHHADYAPDGSIVFEADWSGEQVWRLPSGSTTPVRVQPNSTNDNSPCVLADGRVVSLWLGRQANTQGLHEIKVMPSIGNSYEMALTGADVLDGGIGCGG